MSRLSRRPAHSSAFGVAVFLQAIGENDLAAFFFVGADDLGKNVSSASVPLCFVSDYACGFV